MSGAGLDLGAVRKLVGTVQAALGEVARQADAVTRRIEAGELPTDQGVSFLQMKHDLLLSYNLNLLALFAVRLEGRSIRDHPAIERLVYTRTVLEKIKPIDQKLKYQIDKLIKAAVAPTQGRAATEDPLAFKPNPDNLVPKEADTAEGEGTYQPPKLVATPYEEPNMVARREKKLQKERQKLVSNKLIRELQGELSEQPEEIHEPDLYVGRGKAKRTREDAERTDFEESNFVRLTVSKQDKRQGRKRQRNDLDEITDFVGIKDLQQHSVTTSQDVLRKKSMRTRASEAKASGLSKVRKRRGKR